MYCFSWIQQTGQEKKKQARSRLVHKRTLTVVHNLENLRKKKKNIYPL